MPDHKIRPRSYLSPQYINGLYIPSSLFLAGIAIIKKEWIPFAVVVVAAVAAWKVFNNRQLPVTPVQPEAPKVLNPDDYQEFKLKEKTVLSHNTAM